MLLASGWRILLSMLITFPKKESLIFDTKVSFQLQANRQLGRKHKGQDTTVTTIGIEGFGIVNR